jgi:hypothetical protein
LFYNTIIAPLYLLYTQIFKIFTYHKI